MRDREVFAVIVAGGRGRRMNSQIPKQYMILDGIPVLARTLKSFTSLDFITGTILVLPPGDISHCSDKILSFSEPRDLIHLAPGGKSRQESVMNGLRAVKKQSVFGNPIVLIHDGVRPFTDPSLIKKCLNGAVNNGACIPAIPLTDTLKKTDGKGFTVETVNRKNLFRAQTPQAFHLDLILNAHEIAASNGFSGTDDASLLERLGKKVFIVQGSEHNIKITTQDDLIFAEFLLSRLFSYLP